MTQSVDPSAFREAFIFSLNHYQPFRRTSRHGEPPNPHHDSFWMIIDGADKLGLLTAELRQKFDPNNTLIEAWAAARALPSIDQRKEIVADLKQSLELGR